MIHVLGALVAVSTVALVGAITGRVEVPSAAPSPT